MTAARGTAGIMLAASLVPFLLTLLAAQTTSGPTFARDIAPIVLANCAPCHRPGEAGPFSFLTYEDVKKHARQIASVTARRYMPPWLPDQGHGNFTDERRLSDDQIRVIGEWAAHGAPQGPASETPPAPRFTEGWQLGPPDLIVEAEHSFTVPASGPDVYWNFILTFEDPARTTEPRSGETLRVPASLEGLAGPVRAPEIKTTRYVKAIEIRPSEKRIVHHANVYIDRARTARRQEIAKGEGFPGMDPVIERTAFDPDDGHFLFWKPGGAAYVEPDGMSWRLDPGNDLVLNVHVQPSGKPEEVRPSIGLYFTDEPPDSFPMLVQLEHDGALDIPAGDRDFLVSDDFLLPLDAEILAVYPHAHYLGRLLEGYATLPGGERKWLIRIPAWDPNWQAVYHYRQPVFLPKGSVISMRYHYDNSAANPRNPHRPPQRVVGGNQSTDEMGHLWLQVLPDGKADRRRELQEAALRHRLEKYPGDFAPHRSLGAVMLARLEAPGAAAALLDAVRLNPQDPEARNLLGAALSATGRTGEAVEQFRRALALRTDYPNARLNLANALIKTGQLDEAIANLHQLAAAGPGDGLVRDRLAQALAAQGKVLSSKGQWGDAEACYRELLTVTGGDAGAENRVALAETLAHQGKLAEALAEYDKALSIDSSNEDARAARELVVRRLAAQSGARN